MSFHKHSVVAVLHALLITAAAGFSASLYAMPPMEHSGKQDGEKMARHIDQFHDKLKLNEQQEAQWKRANTESHNKVKSRQAERQQSIKEMKQALHDPQVDLRALSEKMDQRRDRAIKASRETRELWLAFYDSLDARQREMARSFLLERIEHMEKAMERMRTMKRNRQEHDSSHDMEMLH